MQFNTLHLKNFFSHRDTTLSLVERGLVLIAGEVLDHSAANSSGAGKSSLLPEGLLYALFGRTLRGATASDIVRKGSTGGCTVTLTGTDRSGREFTIIRTIANTAQPKDSITIAGATFDGRDEVNRQVGLLLGGVGFDAFVAALVFGKGDTKYFTQLTDATRKAILGELVGFGQLDTLLDVTNQRILEVVKLLNDYSQQYRESQIRINLLNETIANLRPQAVHFARQKRDQAKLLADIIRQADTECIRLAAAIENIDKRIDELTALQADAKKHVQDCSKDLENVNRALVEEGARRAEIDSERRVFVERLEALDARIHELQQMANQPCPLCEQTIPHTHVDSIVETLKQQYLEVEGQQWMNLNLIVATTRTQEALQHAKNAAQLDLDDAIKTSEQTAQALSSTQTERVQQMGARLEWERRKKYAMAEQATLAQETNVAADTIKNSEKLLAEEEARQAELQRLIPAAEHRHALLLYWNTAFGLGGIRSMLLDSVVPFLNDAARRYSEWLTDGMVEVSFATQSTTKKGEIRERFAVDVKIQNGATSWVTASDGQRRRADIIATLALGELALSRIGGHLGLLILDEIFDGLDASGLERAAHVLQRLAEDRQSVFVITHHETMTQYFPKIITVSWNRGVSCLKDGTSEEEPCPPPRENQTQPRIARGGSHKGKSTKFAPRIGTIPVQANALLRGNTV